MYGIVHNMLPFIYAFKTFLKGYYTQETSNHGYLFWVTEVGRWKLDG